MKRCQALDISNISIHALLAESDSKPRRLKSRRKVFLSTLSLRRATGRGEVVQRTSRFLSTLSLRRATSSYSAYLEEGEPISIHALLAESDHEMALQCAETPAFLSTLSLRRATMIHPRLCDAKLNFYPRSPCGERQRSQHQRKQKDDFYPRSPCGERPK